MKPIDTKTWKEFKIGDLFETNNEKAYTGASVKRENLIPGETPRVTVSNINNGITGYYEDIEDTNYRVYNNFISVSFLGTVFYHPYSASVDMKVHVLPKLTNGRDLTTGIGLFLVSAIKASIKRYTYANQISSKVIYDTYIQLPVDQTGQPDWDYMEAFMEQINQQAQARLDEYKDGKVEYTPVDTESWQEFKIEDLFDSQTGDTDLKKPHLNGKGHAVITSGLNNMGVFGYSDEPAKIIKKNTITVDMFGYAIFRPFDYKMVTHARVFSLEPKGFELNEMTGLYMSTIFKHLSTLFNYNNMCSYNKIKHLTVKLPVQQTLDPDKTYHPDGCIPDWNYMEAFMKQINQQAQAKLQQLEKGSI